jgi:hypothetical protein
MATLTQQFDKLKQLLVDIEPDVAKFDKGTKAAGPRVRKAMQTLKTGAQDIREAVLLK